MSRPRQPTGSLLLHPALHLSLLACIALVAYSNTFDVPFQFDDKVNISESPLIKDFQYFAEAYGADGAPARRALRFKSRIVGYLTFALDYRLHGLDVGGYHAVNLAIHIASALLLYWLVLLAFRTPLMSQNGGALSRGGDRVVALFSALFFVSHPVQTQAVTFIVQRLASLAALFYLLSLALYVKSRLAEGKRAVLPYALSLLSAVLAMKTKETAFTLPALAVLFEMLFLSGSPRKRLLYLAPFALVMFAVALPVLGVGASPGGIIGDVDSAARLTEIPRSHYIFTEFRVVATYLRLLFLPVNQNLDYDYPLYGSFLAAPVFLSALLLSSVAALGFLMLRAGASLRLASFGILWFFMALSVESSIIPIEDVIFEHRLYLPIAGFSMVFGTAAFLLLESLRGEKARALAIAVLALWVVSLAAATYARNSVWRSEISLWTDVAEKSPGKARVYNNLGMAYEAEGSTDKAIENYRVFVALAPDNPEAHYNLGSTYGRLGRIDEAGKHLSEAVRLKPDYYSAHYNLANTYIQQGRLDEAIVHYEMTLALKPDHSGARQNLGQAYRIKGL